MSGLSINDILAKIDARLDDIRLLDEDIPVVSLDPLSEVGLYITSDRLLADLYRQYLEAQRHYITCISTHGKDAPMTEIASDMADSSFCAMETRLIELREEKGIADRVARLQQQQREKYIEDMKARQAINQTCMTTNYNPLQEDHIGFWALLAMSFLQQQEAPIAFIEKPATLEFTRAAA